MKVPSRASLALVGLMLTSAPRTGELGATRPQAIPPRHHEAPARPGRGGIPWVNWSGGERGSRRLGSCVPRSNIALRALRGGWGSPARCEDDTIRDMGLEHHGENISDEYGAPTPALYDPISGSPGASAGLPWSLVFRIVARATAPCARIAVP
jgi:hypothetical protein